MTKEIILYYNHDKFPSWSRILAFFHMPILYLDAYLYDENIPSGGAKGYVTGFFFPFFKKILKSLIYLHDGKEEAASQRELKLSTNTISHMDLSLTR